MTKPTREQEQACDILAEALVSITSASRLDGKARFGPLELSQLLKTLSNATSAFEGDAILSRALERRGQALGLRSGTSELLTLLETDVSPFDALLLDDDGFRLKIAEIEEELG